MARLSANQSREILDFLQGTEAGTDPWEAIPAINRTLAILGYEDRFNFKQNGMETIPYKEI